MSRFRSPRGWLAVLVVVLATAVGMPQVLAFGGGDSGTAAERDGADAGGRTVTYSPDDGVSTAALPAQDDLEFVAFSTGCRIFDTRNAGGAFNAGQSRDLSVLNAAIPGQGGVAGGCGIPAYAEAVDLSLSTAGGSPTGAGYVRVGPGGVAATATVLQFLTDQGTSVTTSAPLASNSKMRVTVFNARTHLVGDVLGYWVRTMHATISTSGAGSVVEGSGVTGLTSPQTGFWIVTFERDVADCTPVASPFTSVSGVTGATLNGPFGEVYVRTRNSAFADADIDFRVVVRC
jgi:hypothetical protein